MTDIRNELVTAYTASGLVYCGGLREYKGWIAFDLERLDHGPFNYKVECFDPSSRLDDKKTATMIYVTWDRFLADWKRVNS